MIINNSTLRAAVFYILIFSGCSTSHTHAVKTAAQSGKTNDIWHVIIPSFVVRNAAPAVAREKLEKISQKLDPTGEGIHIWACDDPQCSPFSMNLKQVTIGEALKYIAALSNHSDVRISGNLAIFCDLPSGGQVPCRRVELTGTVVEDISGKPITNATLKTQGGFANASGVTNLQFSADGSFTCMVLYRVVRPQCCGIAFLDSKEDTLKVSVTAPGYEEYERNIDCGEYQGGPHIDVKLKPKAR